LVHVWGSKKKQVQHVKKSDRANDGGGTERTNGETAET